MHIIIIISSSSNSLQFIRIYFLFFLCLLPCRVLLRGGVGVLKRLLAASYLACKFNSSKSVVGKAAAGVDKMAGEELKSTATKGASSLSEELRSV
jgi:hypothetical protein